MNDLLKERILRRLEALPEDKAYMVLDYVEFLESKYAQRQAPGPNVFQRFAEGIEDTLRAGNVSASTVAEAMGFMGKAMNVLSGVAAAGKSVADDLVGATKSAAAPAAPAAPAPKPPDPPKPAGSA
ncbi:MAG: hypothetical protein IPJ78_16165 [Gemmatimonadetes bacterium]|nr:hypothetical protein [Gemmatimonadota bacterium]MBP7548975.1 hypothetical protein [Gemmatimonadaceae bacterium]